MDAAGAGVHLHSRQGSRQHGGPGPNTYVCGNVMGWIREPTRVGRRRQNRKQARRGKCRGAITTELRGAGHLSANAADIAERFVEVVHDRFTLQCKVYRMEKLVNMPLVKVRMVASSRTLARKCC